MRVAVLRCSWRVVDHKSYATGRRRPGPTNSDDFAWRRERGETKLSEEYKSWEARYSAPDYIFGKEPNYFLAKCKPLLPASGRVLAALPLSIIPPACRSRPAYSIRRSACCCRRSS